MLAAGMSKLSDGYDAAMEAMQEVGEEQNMKLEQRNGYIALIAQIGPMFGLLGTVDGMVMAFDVIARSNVTPKPSELAQGIGTALVTTVVGLWIAIPIDRLLPLRPQPADAAGAGDRHRQRQPDEALCHRAVAGKEVDACQRRGRDPGSPTYRAAHTFADDLALSQSAMRYKSRQSFAAIRT